jgi:hypothetical protein
VIIWVVILSDPVGGYQHFEYTCSIFRVEVYRVRNLLGCIGGMQGRWSLTSTGGGKDTTQSDLIGTVNGKMAHQNIITGGKWNCEKLLPFFC